MLLQLQLNAEGKKKNKKTVNCRAAVYGAARDN